MLQDPAPVNLLQLVFVREGNGFMSILAPYLYSCFRAKTRLSCVEAHVQ